MPSTAGFCFKEASYKFGVGVAGVDVRVQNHKLFMSMGVIAVLLGIFLMEVYKLV